MPRFSFATLRAAHVRSARAYMVALTAAACATTFLFLSGSEFRPLVSDVFRSYPEVGELRGKPLGFQELKSYFERVSEKKGAAYAYEILRRADLPPNTDLHLLGHAVGDVLYKQQGVRGIYVCTQDFRNACSHSIVVSLLYERGEAALPEIAAICKDAPGGPGAYTMCFHGLGHGVLAYADYEFDDAILLCERTGTPEFGNREYIECVGGAVMEMISGGFHNRSQWEAARARYLDPKEPLSLCASSRMPEDVREWCFVYLTPYLFEAAGVDEASPSPDRLRDAFALCDALPWDDAPDRRACYGGFGKEFVVLALARDIRDVEHATDAEVLKVYEWCSLAGDEDGVRACVSHAFASFFWGGENIPRAAALFCEHIPDEVPRTSCFSDFIGAVHAYVRDPFRQAEFCGVLPARERERCNESFVP